MANRKLICTCGEHISPDDLERILIFAGNEIEPPEYKYICPYCGQDEIEMDEEEWFIEDLDEVQDEI